MSDPAIIEELIVKFENCDKRIVALTARTSTEREQLRETQRQVAKLEEQVRTEKRRRLALGESLLTHYPMSVRVKNLHLQLTLTMQKAQSIDITKREDEELETLATRLLNELQLACEHRFIFSYSGYEGSHIMDYDDAYQGKRRCLVCGFTERSSECGKDVYQTLTESSTCIIKRDLSKREHPVLFDPFVPISLSKIRKVFLASARKDYVYGLET